MNKKIKKGLFRFINCFILISTIYILKHFIFYHIPFYYYNILSNSSVSKKETKNILYLFSSKKSDTCYEVKDKEECIEYSILGVESIKIVFKEDKIIDLYPKFDDVMLP